MSLSCTYPALTNGKTSLLYEKLKEITKNEILSEAERVRIQTDVFKEWFAPVDWIKAYHDKNHSIPFELLDENGEPALFKDDVGYYYKNTKGQPKYVSASRLSDFSSENLEYVINEIAYFIVGDVTNNNKDIREIIKGLDKNVKDYINAFVKEKKKQVSGDIVANERLALIYRGDNLIHLADTLKQFFKQKSIILTDEEVSLNEERKDSGLNIADSTTINSKDRASANTKMLLSFVPKLDKNFDPVFNPYLGGPVFEKFDVIWQIVEPALANKVPHISKDENGDDVINGLYEKFLNTLYYKADQFPSLAALAGMLESKNDVVKTQFVQAFYKNKSQMVSTVIDGNDVRVMDSSQDTPGKAKRERWFNNFLYNGKIIDSSTESFKLSAPNVRIVDTLVGNYIKLADEFRTNKISKAEYIPRLLKMLDYVGIEISENTIDKLVNEIALVEDISEENALLNVVAGNKDSFLNLFKELGKSNNKQIFGGELTNPLDNQKLYAKIADLEAEANPEGSETTVVTKDGLAWLYDLPNYMNTVLNLAKAGEIEKLKDRLSLPFYKNSKWVQKIVEAVETNDLQFLEKLQIKTLNTFRDVDSNDVKDNKDITFGEQLLDSIIKNNMSNPMFNMLEPADKGRFLHIQGFNKVNPNMQLVGNKWQIVTKEVIDQFYGYFRDEYDRILDVQKNPSTVEYYKNNGKKFVMFDFLSNIEEIKKSIYKSDTTDLFDIITPETVILIKQAIEQNLIEEVMRTMNIVNEQGLKIPQQYINAHGSLTGLVGDFVINGMIANIEMTKLFTGDPAYYKTMTDFKKRVPATYTNGMMLNIDNITDVPFNVAVFNTKEVSSAYLWGEKEKLDNYVKQVVEVVNNARKNEEGVIVDPVTATEIKDLLSSYSKVDRTDAQAYITPARWKFLLNKLGKWSPAHETAYENLMKGIPTKEDIKIAAQPLKGVYFSIENGKPVYLKYSQAVLIPSLVNGTHLEQIAKKMEGKVDEAIFTTGVKVGADNLNEVTAEDGSLSLPEGDLKVMLLDNRFWKLQQDLPSKGVKDTDIGSQIQKNILADFLMWGTYSYNGESIKGTDLYKMLDNTFIELSNMGAQKITEKFINEDGTINTEAIRKTLIDELTRTGQDENLLQALNKGLPYDALPSYKQKIQSLFYNQISKKTVKIKTSGGAFIQMSNFGLDKLTSSELKGITWIKPHEDLKPPLIENGVLKPGQILIPHSLIAKYMPNYKKMSRAQLLSNIDSRIFEAIGYRIPNQGMSSNDVLEIVGILPEELGDTVIAYAEITAKTGSDFDIDKMYIMLPHFEPVFESAFNHMQDFLKFGKNDKLLANILREENIIDLDVKAPTFKQELVQALLSIVKDEHTDNSRLADITEEFQKFTKDHPKSVKRLDYIDHNDTSEKALHNRIIHIYSSILKDPKSYPALITSIDRATKMLREDIDSLFKEDAKTGLRNFNPVDELISKQQLTEGKTCTGINANNLVDHVISQTIPLASIENLGFGHGKDFSQILDSNKQNKITDVLSAFLNAFVDIAKDPYILRANYNNFTANSAFLLLRLGTPLKTVTRFIGQPVLREYAKLKALKDTSVNESYKYVKLKEKMLKDYKVENSSDIDVMSLEKIHDTYFKGNALEENINNPDPELQYAVLSYFIKLQPYSKTLGEIVNATKSDVKGATSSAAERQGFENVFQKALNNNLFTGFADRFNNTRFSAFYNNSIKLAGKISSKIFLEETDGARAVKNEVLNKLGKELTTDTKTLKLVSQEFYTYLMSGTRYANPEISRLIESVPKQLRELQNTSNNPFIQNLVIDKNKKFKFVKSNSVRNKSDYFKNTLYKGWLELLSNKDTKQFGEDLIQYSFITSGFKHGIGKFFESIPHDWVGMENLDERIKQMINNLSNANEATTGVMISTFLDQYARHNWTTLPKVTKVKVSKDAYYPDVTTLESLGKDILNNPIYPEYIQHTYDLKDEYDIKSGTATNVLRLVGTDMGNPVYIRTSKLGFSGKGNRIQEYRPRLIPTSQLSVNNGIFTTVEAFLESHLNVIPTNTLVVENNKTIPLSNESPIVSLQSMELKVDTTASWSNLKNQPVYTEQGVNTMRTANKEAEHAYFGNPFSEAGYAGTIKMPTVEAAVQAYKDWLITDEHSNVKPQQRQWILEQINSGKLDNATLLYDGKLAGRGLGTHAHALAEVVSEIRNTKQPTLQSSQKVTDTTEEGLDFNFEELTNNVNYVFTNQGATIASLGFTNEQWNAMTEEERNNIIECK